MNLFDITLKNLWHRKIRTLLTIAGVGVSIAAFVALLGFTNSLEDSLRKTYKARGTDLIVISKGTVDIFGSTLDEKYLPLVKQIPRVEDVSPILIDIYAFKLKEFVLLYGWEQGSYLFDEIKVIGQKPRSPNELILGSMAAKRLDKKIGDQVKIKDALFKVVGIYQSKSVLEEGAGIMLLDRLQELKKAKGIISMLNLKIRTAESRSPAYNQTDELIEKNRVEIMNRYPELEVKNIRSFISANTPLYIVLDFTWAISVVAFIIVILGIVNTMTTSVMERTKEIGILLAMGWSKTRITALIVIEAVLLGFLGGILGVIMGYGIMSAIVSASQLQGIMAVTYDYHLVMKVMFISLGLGFVSGIYPALKAVSIDPIRILRYE